MPRHNPYCVKLELVRGCTQRCPFCSLPHLIDVWEEGHRWQFMKRETFVQVVTELAAWLPKVRLELEGRGEPSFHPQLHEFLCIAREVFPKVQILLTTNGDMSQKKKKPGEFEQWVKDTFNSGLNVMMLDCYTAERYEEMCRRFPEGKRFFEDKIHPYGYRGPKEKLLILANMVAGNENTIRHYHNQGGTVDVERARAAGFNILTAPEPLKKMCVRPFRELVVWNDGSVPICCNDWLPANVIGKVGEQPLQHLWYSWQMEENRKMLLARSRGAIKPCDVCTERAGFRVGLEMGWFNERR